MVVLEIVEKLDEQDECRGLSFEARTLRIVRHQAAQPQLSPARPHPQWTFQTAFKALIVPTK